MGAYTVLGYRCRSLCLLALASVLVMMVIHWNSTTCNYVPSGDGKYHTTALIPPSGREEKPRRNGEIKSVDKNYKNCSTDGNICQHGRIRPGRKYAVFTASLYDGQRSVNYFFDLPLTVLAWHRLGYDCIVMIINDPWTCKKDSKIHVLMETLLDMDGVVLLILKGMPQTHSVTTSQLSRLFVSTLLQDGGDPVAWNDTYIVTADADTWPLGHGFFDLPSGKEVLHGNWNNGAANKYFKQIFHGELAAHGPAIHMALSYIGMKVKTWIEVMSMGGDLHLPRSPGEVITYVQDVFGKGCCNNVHHAGPGWNMDQLLASRRIHEWKITNKKIDKVYVYYRAMTHGRWANCHDRVHWVALNNLTDLVDSHVLQYNYKSEVWPRMRPLLNLMHPDNGTLAWCEQYATSFRNQTAVC